jgi:hypothetical protein
MLEWWGGRRMNARFLLCTRFANSQMDRASSFFGCV